MQSEKAEGMSYLHCIFCKGGVVFDENSTFALTSF